MLNDQLRAASVPVSELTGTPTGGGSRMTTEGAIRWLPIGIPLEPRPHEARIASLDRGQRWTGDRFIRCRLKGATPNTWQDGLPERECKILPRSAETARNAHVLREIEDNELPIVGRLMLVNDITDDPGRHALHGTRYAETTRPSEPSSGTTTPDRTTGSPPGASRTSCR